MSDAFRFENFVDVHSNIFNEYLSSVIAKLSKENEKYQALQDVLGGLYEKYPTVLGGKGGGADEGRMCGSHPSDRAEKSTCGYGIAVGLPAWLL